MSFLLQRKRCESERSVRDSDRRARRVYPRGADNLRVPEPVLVSIDIAHIGFRS
jgi:hypothetical protein